jgi:hypothetical protein
MYFITAGEVEIELPSQRVRLSAAITWSISPCDAQRTNRLIYSRRQRWRGLARFIRTVAKPGLAPQ